MVFTQGDPFNNNKKGDFFKSYYEKTSLLS